MELDQVSVSSLSESDLSSRIEHPKTFVNKVFELSVPVSRTGFKLMLDQSPCYRDEIIGDPSWKKVLLYRDNVLASFSSELIAKATGIGRAHDQTSLSPTTVQFCAYQFNVYRERRRRLYEQVRTALNVSRSEYFEIEYLDIVERDVQHDLFDFLGITPPDHVKISDVKRNPPDIAGRFSNKEYVLEYLQMIAKESWVRESRESRTNTVCTHLINNDTRDALWVTTKHDSWVSPHPVSISPTAGSLRDEPEPGQEPLPTRLLWAHFDAYSARKYKLALAHVDRLISGGTADAAIEAYRLRTLARLRRCREVRSTLKNFLETEHTAELALRLVASELVNSFQCRSAMHFLKPMAELYPHIAEVHFQIGRCMERTLWFTTRCIDKFELAMTMRPDNLLYLIKYLRGCVRYRRRGVSKKLQPLRKHYLAHGAFNILMAKAYIYERNATAARLELELSAEDPRTSKEVKALSKKVARLEQWSWRKQKQ